MINELLIMPEEAFNTDDNRWCQKCRYVDFYDGFLCRKKKARKYANLFTKGIWIHDSCFWRECQYYRRDDK